MKWNTKHRSYNDWEKWFAWYPVKTSNCTIWLEYVLRKQVDYEYAASDFEYKETENV